MAEYGGWVTLGDKSSKPPAPNPLKKSGSWLKPIYLTKSELLQALPQVAKAGRQRVKYARRPGPRFVLGSSASGGRPSSAPQGWAVGFI